MSHYITRFCKTHGEWDMDSDFNSECPECEALGLTELQQLRDALTLATQRAEAAEAERDHYMRVGVKRLDSIFELEVERNALRTERDALRKVDDAMVERAYRAGNFADRVDDIRAALDAALAVQP